MWTSWKAIAVGCVAGLLGGCGSLQKATDWVLDKAVAQIPAQVDDSLGDQGLAEVRQTLKFVTDESTLREVQDLISPLLKPASRRLEVPINVHLAIDPTVNAFALPGGEIVLPTGFLLFADSPEEVQGVFAHEIAHVTERHSLRRLLVNFGMIFALQMLLGDASALVQGVVMQGAELLSLKYSRDDEREADRVGITLLKESGLGQHGLARFFERLHEFQRREAEVPAVLEKMLSTHPLTTERIENIRNLAQKVDGTPQARSAYSVERFRRLQGKIRTLQPASQVSP